MDRPSETTRLSGRLGNMQPPVESVADRLARLDRPVHLRAVLVFSFSVSSSSYKGKKDKTVMPATERNNKALRTPTSHRLHRLVVSCVIMALSGRAMTALSAPPRPCARACVSCKGGFSPATAAAARSGYPGGPSSNRVGNVLGGRNA